MKSTLDRIQQLSEELLAILLLEYHNKNHLRFADNPKKLNEEMREIVDSILFAVEKEKGNM